MIPSLAEVRVRTRAGRSIGLWIPLFLLWLVALLISPLLLAALLVATLIVGMRAWKAAGVFWGLLWSLSGINVEVRAEDVDVRVRVV
jgi:hypothetical protein